MTATTTEITARRPVPQWIETDYDAMAGWDVARLQAEWRECLGFTAARLARMAAIVRRLDEAGAELDSLQGRMLSNLRRIASGTATPELVVACLGDGSRLTRVLALPGDVQDRVASNVAFPVACLGPDGNHTHRMVPVQSMNDTEFRQVFAADHVRDLGEQVSWQREAKRGPTVSGAVVDRRRGGIVVTGKHVFLSKEQLKAFVRELA
jgi:S1-C subfamily serine protease